jgi:flagellar basal-body rod modification protein FlgD
MTSSVSGTSGIEPAASSSAAAKRKELGDKDTFLKLLVAQLKYQDPTKPADASQFMAQTAQFTQVEKLGDIADLLKAQRLVGVSGLVGHTVNYMDEQGAHQSGVISAAKLNGDSEPMLRIGNTDVALSKVMEVLPMAQTTGTAGSTESSTASKPGTGTTATTGTATA